MKIHLYSLDVLLTITLNGQNILSYTCIDYAAVMNEKYPDDLKLKALNEKFYNFSVAAYKYYIG